MATAELVLDTQSILGEGPIWDVEDRSLWWIDIEAGLVHQFDPATSTDKTFDIGQRIGTVVRRQQGGLILGLADGIGAYDTDRRELAVLCNPEADLADNRFNDGKCDPAGRFWAGTLNFQDESIPSGALYCLHPDGSIVKHFDGVQVSNGIVWTSDAKTMYYIDSPTRSVDAFDYDLATGEISNRRSVVEFTESQGYPDGMTIDSEDMIWVAQWAGWGVTRFDPRTGTVLEKIDVAAAQVTACAFGGPDLTDLYITTARRGITGDDLDAQPHAGGLFVAKTGAKGVPSFRFAG